MRHSLRAFTDLILGLRANRDQPVSKYCLTLSANSDSRKIRLDNQIEHLRIKLTRAKDEHRRQNERELRRLQASRDAFESQVERKKEQIERSHSLLSQAKADFEIADKDYQTWRMALGRPPYRTQYRSLYDHIKYQFIVKEPNQKKAAEISSVLDVSTLFSTLPKRIIAVVIIMISALVIPFDVYYSYPGFKVVLEDERYAVAASILLGIILATVGATLGVLFSLAFKNSVSEDLSIKTKAQPGFFLMFVLCIFIALTVIYAGATIRSIVPEANALSAEKSKISTRLSILGSTIYQPVSIRERNLELDRLGEIIQEIELSEQEIKSVFTPRLTADALIAFCFYGFGVFSIMIARITVRDPILEYHLATINRENAQQAMLRFENQVEEGLSEANAIVSATDAEIDNAQMVLKEDVVDNDISEEISLLENEKSAIESEEHDKMKRDSLIYAKAFGFFSRDKNAIREWEELFEGK